MRYEIEEYVTVRGKSPYAAWLGDLKDLVAVAKITARLDRAAYGHFGDWKPIAGAKGIFELRENYGPGYRVYFALIGGKIILLLAGSSKKDQRRAIAKAIDYLEDYEDRSGQ